MVTIGVLMEFPEVAQAANKSVRKLKKLDEPKDLNPWWELVIVIGWVLVAGGLALEWRGDARINSVDADLDRVTQAIIAKTQGLAVAAESSAQRAQDSASSAQGSAHAAVNDSGDAKSLARGARVEADALTSEIKSANDKAADAVSRLAGAEQKLREATQGELKAEQELNWLKTPRSIEHFSEVLVSLKPFKGTKYVFSGVFADDESITLLQSIDDLLQKAGWERDKSVSGFPAINVFGKSKPDVSVPAALISGIQISVESTTPIETLQATKASDLPENFRAASVLRQDLESNLIPAAKDGVYGSIQVDHGTSVTVQISVGKKPLQ
jgi:hypothetical protein